MMFLALIACLPALSLAYTPAAAVQYSARWWNSTNHDCKTGHDKCSPYSYWGNEHCNQASFGGDCANFVSQSLIAGGHPYLAGGAPCRGYPCGKEEIGAKNLGDCLAGRFRWKRTCGHLQPPPAGLKVGDVLVYHAKSCSDFTAHATIVTQVPGAGQARITCHSSSQLNRDYKYLASTHPYYEWLQHTNSDLTEEVATA